MKILALLRDLFRCSLKRALRQVGLLKTAGFFKKKSDLILKAISYRTKHIKRGVINYDGFKYSHFVIVIACTRFRF